MRERAISEVLGYVIIFSMILLMVGIVYTGGAANLQEVRDNQQVVGVERAFVAVDSDVTDIARDGAPSRSSTIRLNGGTLTFGGGATMNVTVGTNTTNSYRLAPMVYRFDGEPRLAYVGGMVLRSGGDGEWVVVSDPPVVTARNDTGALESVLLPVLDTDGTGSAQGARSLTIDTAIDDRQDIVVGDRQHGDLTVTVNVTDTPRAGAWGRYFNRTVSTGAGDACEPTGPNGTTCSFETDAFRAAYFPVEVTLS